MPYLSSNRLTNILTDQRPGLPGNLEVNGLVSGKIYRKPWFLPSNIGLSKFWSSQWIGLRENLRETRDFPMNIYEIYGVSCNFSSVDEGEAPEEWFVFDEMMMESG